MFIRMRADDDDKTFLRCVREFHIISIRKHTHTHSLERAFVTF